MCKSTIQPIPSKVDRMLLQMLLHYFNLFSIYSRRRFSQGITLGFTRTIHYISRHLEIT